MRIIMYTYQAWIDHHFHLITKPNLHIFFDREIIYFEHTWQICSKMAINGYQMICWFKAATLKLITLTFQNDSFGSCDI